MFCKIRLDFCMVLLCSFVCAFGNPLRDEPDDPYLSDNANKMSLQNILEDFPPEYIEGTYDYKLPMLDDYVKSLDEDEMHYPVKRYSDSMATDMSSRLARLKVLRAKHRLFQLIMGKRSSVPSEDQFRKVLSALREEDLPRYQEYFPGYNSYDDSLTGPSIDSDPTGSRTRRQTHSMFTDNEGRIRRFQVGRAGKELFQKLIGPSEYNGEYGNVAEYLRQLDLKFKL